MSIISEEKLLLTPPPPSKGLKICQGYTRGLLGQPSSRGWLTEYLTDYSRLQVHKHSPGYMLSGSSLTEEGIEGVVTAADCFITWHLTIRLDAMLQTVQLPAGVTNLDAGLAYVDTDTFTLKKND